jgi:hypothetical protein
MLGLDMFRRLRSPATDEQLATPTTSVDIVATRVLVAKSAKLVKDLVEPRLPSFVLYRVDKNVRWVASSHLGAAASFFGNKALFGVDTVRQYSRSTARGAVYEANIVGFWLWIIDGVKEGASSSNALKHRACATAPRPVHVAPSGFSTSRYPPSSRIRCPRLLARPRSRTILVGVGCRV